MVMAMADALAREFGTAAPTLVVRPHPTNPAPFKAFRTRRRHLSERRRPGRLARVVAGVLRSTHARVVCVRIEYDGVSGSRGGQSPVPDDREREVLAGAGTDRTLPHLLKGEFLEVCRDMDDVATHVRRILDGAMNALTVVASSHGGSSGRAASTFRPVTWWPA
jgi:hypothetical protein